MLDDLKSRFAEELETLDLEMTPELVRKAVKAYLERRIRRRERFDSMTQQERDNWRREKRDEKRRERAREKHAQRLEVIPAEELFGDAERKADRIKG